MGSEMCIRDRTKLGHMVGADFSFKIYQNALRQPYVVHASRNSSEVIAGITEKSNLAVNQVVLPALALVSSSLLAMSIVVTLVAIEPFVALSAFACFGCSYTIIIIVTKNRLAANGQQINDLTTQRIKILQEGLGGIRDVILAGVQGVYLRVYRKTDLPLRHALATTSIISAAPRFAIESFGMVLIAVIAYFMVSYQGAITNTLPTLGALALGAQRMLPLLQLLYSSWSRLKAAEATLEDLLRLLEQPVDAYSASEDETSLPVENVISLSNVKFRYSEHSSWVVNNLTLDIVAGNSVGLIGRTGSGKSTLLDIMMGLLNPVEGALMVDGQPINDENRRRWQKNISHVPQVIFLADATVAENIAFGVPLEEIDYDRVQESARMAQIDDIIESWPKQYDEMVGERGIRLSGGQRQRIGIARAFYNGGNVVVFDEATSALDPQTEAAVMAAMSNYGRDLTIVMVAHRLSTLRNCDYIIELDKGTVTRSGTYDDIIGI